MDSKVAIDKGLLSAHLATIDVNAKELACPKYSQGEIGNCSKKSEVNNDWDAGLPNDLIWSLFFNKSQYEYCKDIFNSPIFLNNIVNVKLPSEDAIKWFEKNSNYEKLLVPLEVSKSYSNFDELDTIQKKMITVFFNIKSWTYCSEEKINGSYLIHGSYNSERNIILYRTSCFAKKVYNSEIKNLALTFKYHFIGAHELAHAIDDLNGTLYASSEQARINNERKANLMGLLITKGLCRLFNVHFNNYKNVMVNNISLNKECDLYFVNQVVDKWRDVEFFLDQQINKVLDDSKKNKSLKLLKKDDFSAWGCIEER
jgi:hypothetical protein